MIRCIQCGRELPEDAQFCSTCGHRVLGQSGGAPQRGVEDVTSQASERVAGDLGFQECPICGKYNQIPDTFRCKKCRRPWICLAHQERKYLTCIECAEVDIAELVKQHNQCFAQAVLYKDPGRLWKASSPRHLDWLILEIQNWQSSFFGPKDPQVKITPVYASCSVANVYRSGCGVAAEITETWERVQEIRFLAEPGPDNVRVFTNMLVRKCKYEMIYDGEWIIDRIKEIEPLRAE